MREPPQIRALPDGRRHFHDGPIDLIIDASGERDAVEAAYASAARRFMTILDELCAELPLLRSPATPASPRPEGVVARRMAAAVAPFRAHRFVTPMAAVAGAVAEEVLAAMARAAPLRRAYVNNGGDIALHLAEDASFTIGMVERPDRLSLFGRARIEARDGVRGVATSGWRGRSFSLGVADAVTVLATSASLADVAATLIANATDLPDHPAVTRLPARAIDPQSDLGDRLVTRNVGELLQGDIAQALEAGAREAEFWRRAGLIEAAAIRVSAGARLVGADPALYKPPSRAPIPSNEKQVRHAVG